MSKIKYLLVTDIPAPWREKVYENVYNKLGDKFHVIYCNYNEKRRLWKFSLGNHPKTFLYGFTSTKIGSKENYFNFGIIPFLFKHQPQIIICFSFNPTIFLSFLLGKFLRSKMALFVDTWLERDRNISIFQKIIRKIACNFFADAFIGPSKKTLLWFKHYNKNLNENSLFLSALCADNDYFNNYLKNEVIEKKYDILFSGRIVEEKNPIFFAEVAKKVKNKRGICKVLIIGEGDGFIKREMFKVLEEGNITYYFAGFIHHKDLPKYYSQAKLLLLPTSGDCWGVVLNEAMVCGLPVITTNMTAAAGELVIDGENGYILPLDSELWAEKICSLLTDEEKYKTFSLKAKEKVSEFTFEQAAQGIIDAIKYLENLRK